MSAASKNVFAPLPTTERGHTVCMAGDPKGDTFAYTRNNYVIVRNLKNPLDSYSFNAHAVRATAIRYAPSGNYIASGDAKGMVKIWDTTQPDHRIKYEYQVLGGEIRDIAWTEDSKRLGVVGKGNDIVGRTILWDSGSNCGDISGHVKQINACDIKPNRPYRFVTGSEDTDIGFFAGPPFKKEGAFRGEPNKYVNTLRYAGDGSFFVAGDSGGKLYVYEGKEGAFVTELNGGEAAAHKGGVYGVSWSADNKRMVSCSADKTVKIWDVEANKAVTTFTAGTDVGDQQLGCLWQGDTILSTGLNGFIKYWDEKAPGAPSKIIQGHATNVTAMTLNDDGSNFFAGSTEGRVSNCDTSTGQSTNLGNTHKSQVMCMAQAGGKLYSAAMDDTVMVTPVGSDKLEGQVKLSSQPKGIDTVGDACVVASVGHITLLRGGNRAFEVAAPYGATSVSIAPSGAEVAVGGEDKKVHVYTIDGDTLAEKTTLDAGDVVLCVGYAPSGGFLAASGNKRQVLVWDATKYGEPENHSIRWKHHDSKVTCLAWSPDSTLIATGSLDTHIIIYNMAKTSSRIKIAEAHPSGCITSIAFASANVVYSSGLDGAVRSWDITPA